MKISKYVWLDGKIMPIEKANLPVHTHALHYGSSVFEGIRSYKTGKGAAIFRLEDHLKRFFFSASALRLNVRFSDKT